MMREKPTTSKKNTPARHEQLSSTDINHLVSSSMSIHQKAIEAAVARLKAVGAQFHIVDREGTEYGEPIKKKRNRVAQVNGPSLLHLYQTQAKSLEKIGDVLVIDIPEGVDPKRLKNNAETYTRNLYGNGSVMGCIENNQLQIMRLK